MLCYLVKPYILNLSLQKLMLQENTESNNNKTLCVGRNTTRLFKVLITSSNYS